MVIETLYDRMGGMGRFQLMTSILIALCQVPAGWSMLQMTFAGVIPDFHCLVQDDRGNIAGYEENENNNNWNGQSKFHLNDTLNKCSMNGTSCDAYLYDTSAQTVVTEWGLVCDKKWVKKLIISIQMGGVLLGAIIAGQFSDIFGRKRVLYTFSFLHIFLNVIAGFSVGWIMFAVMRFLLGACIGAIIVVVTPFQMEFLPVKWRPLLGVIPSFTLGVTIFAGAAALFENWAHLHFACAGLCLISFLCGWFVPESPRWLAVHGRINDAELVIKRIARMNREKVPEDTISILCAMRATEDMQTEKTHKYTYLDLFKKRFTTKLSMIFFYYWFILAVVYYGISFGVGSFVGNIYLNIFLLGVMEIPVQVSTFFLNNRIGRRKTALLFLSFCFSSLLGCLLFHELSEGSTEDTAINVLSLVAKMMIGCAWSSIHVWGTELFPTVVRNLGCGFSTLGARVGGILAPFIIDLDYMMSQSYGILCVLLVLGAFVAFAVPDTKGKVLNDHVSNGMMNDLASLGGSLAEKEDVKKLSENNLQGNESNDFDTKEKDAFISCPENV